MNHGFKTIVVEDGDIKSRMNFVPKYGNIKIKHKDTTAEQLRLIELNLRKKYTDIKTIVTEKIDSIEGQVK